MAPSILGSFIGGDLASRRVIPTVSAIWAAGPAEAISTQVFADKPNVSVAVMALGVVTVAPLIVATEWGKMATAPTAPVASEAARAGDGAEGRSASAAGELAA